MTFFEKFPLLDLPFFPDHGKRQLRRDIKSILSSLERSSAAAVRANAAAKRARAAADRAQEYSDAFSNGQ